MGLSSSADQEPPTHFRVRKNSGLWAKVPVGFAVKLVDVKPMFYLRALDVSECRDFDQIYEDTQSDVSSGGPHIRTGLQAERKYVQKMRNEDLVTAAEQLHMAKGKGKAPRQPSPPLAVTKRTRVPTSSDPTPLTKRTRGHSPLSHVHPSSTFRHSPSASLRSHSHLSTSVTTSPLFPPASLPGPSNLRASSSEPFLPLTARYSASPSPEFYAEPSPPPVTKRELSPIVLEFKGQEPDDVIDLCSPSPKTPRQLSPIDISSDNEDGAIPTPEMKTWPRSFLLADIVACFDTASQVVRGGLTVADIFGHHFPGMKFKKATYYDTKKEWDATKMQDMFLAKEGLTWKAFHVKRPDADVRKARRRIHAKKELSPLAQATPPPTVSRRIYRRAYDSEDDE
jgi:hypothetical protein